MDWFRKVAFCLIYVFFIFFEAIPAFRYNSFLIFRPALGEIMDEHIHHDLIDEIRMHSLEVSGVIDTEKCWVRKTGMVYIVDLHVEVAGDISVFEGHEISHRLKDHLMDCIPTIADVLIHIEPARKSN